MNGATQAAQLFRRRFVQRTDVYAVQLDSGGYTVVRQPLTDEVIRQHLQARLTLGLYSAVDSTTKWLCLDIDTHGEAEIRRLWQGLESLHLPYLTEFSGQKGYHLWVFFSSPIPNWLARRMVRDVADGHEVFPKQDRIPEGGLGNLVKAPWGVHRVTGVRCVFVDQDLQPLPDQEQALAEAKTVDAKEGWHGYSLPTLSSVVQPGSMLPSALMGNIRSSHLAPQVPVMKDCVQSAVREGTKQGRRNRVGYVIATELRRIGMSRTQARYILSMIWNGRNQPPLAPEEICSVTHSAYHGAEYTFGCRPNGGLREVLECVGRDQCLYARILTTFANTHPEPHSEIETQALQPSHANAPLHSAAFLGEKGACHE